jgi:hypothetical protein
MARVADGPRVIFRRSRPPLCAAQQSAAQGPRMPCLAAASARRASSQGRACARVGTRASERCERRGHLKQGISRQRRFPRSEFKRTYAHKLREAERPIDRRQSMPEQITVMLMGKRGARATICRCGAHWRGLQRRRRVNVGTISPLGDASGAAKLPCLQPSSFDVLVEFRRTGDAGSCNLAYCEHPL